MMKLKKTAAGLSPAAAQVSGESRRSGLPADPRDQNGILAAGRNYSDDPGLVTAYELSIWVALGKSTASGAAVFRSDAKVSSRNPMFAECHGTNSLNRCSPALSARAAVRATDTSSSLAQLGFLPGAEGVSPHTRASTGTDESDTARFRSHARTRMFAAMQVYTDGQPLTDRNFLTTSGQQTTWIGIRLIHPETELSTRHSLNRHQQPNWRCRPTAPFPQALE